MDLGFRGLGFRERGVRGLGLGVEHWKFKV